MRASKIAAIGDVEHEECDEGQVSEIEVTEQFLDMQISKAEEDKKKNQKMYKTLGIVAGLVIVIILI